MKKILIALLTFFFPLTACGRAANINDDSSENDSSEYDSSGEVYKNKVNIDFSNCVANIQDASYLRISKPNRTDIPQKYSADNPGSILFKNENGIENMIEVTFTRFTTKVVSTPVTGETNYYANKDDDGKGFIEIYAEETFTYSLFNADNQELLANITDNSDKDSDDKLGTIRINDLIPHEYYTVKYSGYRETEEITQEELEGEIDKLYVFSPRFTFVSFVPKGESMRPTDDLLEYDIDGISKYDKTDYSNSEYRKSFVFDNCSGLIYSLEGVNIASVDNGLVFTNGEYCDILPGEDGTLMITPICKNKTLIVSYAFKDKYGNKFILNDKLETYDAKSNSYYYLQGTPDISSNISTAVAYADRYMYVKTTTNEVIRFPACFEYGGDMNEREAPQTIDVILENGNIRQLDENDTFGLLPPYSGERISVPRKVVNGFVYIEKMECLTNNFVKLYGSAGMWYLKNDGDVLKTYHVAAWAMFAANLYYMKNFDVMLVLGENGKIHSIQHCLQYAVDNCDESGMVWVGNPSLELEVDGVYVKELITGVTIEGNKIIQYGVDGNTYYDVFVEGTESNPVISIHETGTYVPEEPETTSIVLQPINR